MLLELDVLDALLQSKLYSISTFQNEQLELRMHGPIAPNAQLKISFTKKIRYERAVLLAAIASWYLGDFGKLLRVNLEEFNLHHCVSKKTEIALCLSSKAAMLEVLSSLTPRSFYGNQLPDIINLAKNLYLHWQNPQRARRLVRRRGYRDHGTLIPRERWKPRNDWSLTELQSTIEAIRQEEQDTLDFLRGLCE